LAELGENLSSEPEFEGLRTRVKDEAEPVCRCLGTYDRESDLSLVRVGVEVPFAVVERLSLDPVAF